MIKVGIFTKPIDQGTSGSGHHLLEIVNHLLAQARDNFKIVLIHYQQNDNSVYKKTNEIIIPRNPFKAARILRKENFDILHYSPLTIFSPVYNIKAKKVATVHGEASTYLPKEMGAKKFLHDTFIRPFLLRKMDGLLTVSRTSCDFIINKYKINKDKISICYNAVNPNYKINDKYKSSKENYFFHLSKFSLRKNPWTILNAYKKYKEEFKSNTLLFIAGSGWDNRAVEDFIKEHKLQDSIRLLGFVTEEESVKLYNGAKIFIFPSHYEGCGMPNLESMACGTPVITSSVFAIPEIVSNAALLLKDADDIEELVKKMNLLENDSVLRKTLIEKGLQRAHEFSWKESADTVFNTYISILDRRR